MFDFLKKKKIIQLPTFERLSENYDVVIHIGAPKTGSSAIQKYLLENRSKLLEMGFYYPKHGLDENGISGGHYPLAHMLIERDFTNAKLLFQNYLKEAKQQNYTLLISAESLYGLATQLKQVVGDCRCKIITFFRDPLESLYSNYNQGIKRNYLTVRLNSHCQHQLENPNNSLSGKIFSKWENMFGKENLMVLGYDLELFSQISIQSLFLSVLGIDSTIQKKLFKFDSNFVNNSYSLAALEFKRMLNFVLDQENASFNNEIDWFLQKLTDKDTNARSQLAERINTKTYNQLKEKFSSSIEDVRNNHLLELNPNFLNESKLSNLKTINPLELSLEITDILIKLKQQKPEIYHYIQQQIEHHWNENNQSYEIIKLAEMFNYDINQLEDRNNNEQLAWFSSSQFKNMPNMQLVDFYRDIAYLCYRRNDFENAQLLIKKALEIRPKGPAIIELSELIQQAVNAAK